MEELQEIAPGDRGKLVLKWRTTLGWNVGEIAKRVGVSTRTISAIESGAQVMPDARWRLFVHEVLAEIDRSAVPTEVVVVLDKRQAVLDVVSRGNYAGYAIDDDGRIALIASYSVNRLSGAPELHRQRFPVAQNIHVMRAIERWEADRQEATQDRAIFEMHRWLTRRVLEGELRNPELTELKEAIHKAKSELDQADNEPDEVRKFHMRKLDVAIANLMEAVAQATRK